MRRRRVALSDLMLELSEEIESWGNLGEKRRKGIAQRFGLFQEDLEGIDQLILEVLSARRLEDAFDSVDRFTLGQ